MKNLPLRGFLLLLAFAGVHSYAAEPQFLPDFSEGGTIAAPQQTPGPIVRSTNLFMDFRSRVEAAVKSQDLVAIQALYQTNGMAAEELKHELPRWRRILDEDAGTVIALWWFKDLKNLGAFPPKAREIWNEQAHRITSHQVTHLALVKFGSGVQLILPLVVVKDRLLIVPSDKRNMEARLGIEPTGPAPNAN
jgi:hypothetical protein